MGSSWSLPETEPVVARTEPAAASELRVDVGVLLARSPGADPEAVRRFATQLARDVAPELGDATDIQWQFHAEEPASLPDGQPRRPSEFLDEAIHRMVEGAYDVVVVVTDVALLSRRERYAPGLASPLARTAVVSTRNLRGTGGRRPSRPLDAPAVRWNAAALLLHLVGHVLGAGHREADGGIMEPFRFDPALEAVPAFDAVVERHLERIAGEVPDEEARSRNRLRRLAFYARSVAGNASEIGRALLDSRALLLPFSLPKLATAAVTPTLVIVFSAEAWDVGFHMTDATAVLFAVASIVAAATYLLYVQNLAFPRKRHRVITEHAALVNVTVFVILLLAMVGLFLLVGSIMLVIELVVFPPNLMSNWPSLEQPAVGLADLVRTAAFISTIGVLSGALAGGLESRAIIRHLTLFLDEP
jgi:predicted Zn-dependent protease